MSTTHKGTDVAARVQAAVDRSGMSRNEVARRAGLETSRFAKFCNGKLPLDEEELATVARVVDVPLRDLIGVQLSNVVENEPKNPDAESHMSAASANGHVSDRVGDGRRKFIEEHRDELSARDIEWLQRLRIGLDGGPGFEPESDRTWRALLDEHHREEIRRRDSGR